MKLLLIRIVASNNFGLSRNCRINLSLRWFLDLNVSRFAGESEKNAVSEPETRPDAMIRTMITMIDTIASVEKPLKNCPATIASWVR